MSDIKYIGATGQKIFEAGVEGGKRGYSRSTEDCEVYEEILRDQYEYCLENLPRPERRALRRATKNDWRQAVLPVMFVMEHEHYESGEIHARVMLLDRHRTVIDVPLCCFEAWEGYGVSCLHSSLPRCGHREQRQVPQPERAACLADSSDRSTVATVGEEG